jgi:hypothetical protein
METRKSRAEQRKKVWSGCQTVLGCGGIIALGAFSYFAVGYLLRPVESGPDVIVFLNYKSAQNSLLWCGLVGGVFFFLLLAATKSTRGIVIVCTLFIAAAGIAVWGQYSSVAAIEFHDNSVELRYIWPKPAVRLEAHEITSVEYEQSVHLSDESLLEYALHLRTVRRHYVSFGDKSLDDMQRTIRRIQEMRGR